MESRTRGASLYHRIGGTASLTLRCVSLFWLAATAGCQSSPADQLRPLTAPELASSPGPVALSIDGLDFAPHDFIVAERVLRLLNPDDRAPVASGTWLDSPINRRTILRQTIHNGLLAREAQARGITATDEEALAELQRSVLSDMVRDEDIRRQRLDALAPLQWDDVIEAARLRILRERWTTLVAEETLTDDVLLQLWTADEDRMRIAVVLIPNRPTPEEITRALQERVDDVEAWFNNHRGWFRQETTVDVSFLPIDAPADQLNTIADAVQGDPTATPDNAGERIQRPVTERDLSAAFLHDRGECFAATLDGQQGVACVESTRLTQYGQWDDQGVRRAAAARLLEVEAPLPGPLAEATTILEHWRTDSPETFQAWLQPTGHEVQVTPWFSAASGGSIPLLGDVPRIHRILFELLDEPGEFVQQPFLTPHGVAAVRLVERNVPDAADFASIADAYLEEVRPRFEADAWERFLQSFIDAHSPEMDVEMIRQAEDAIDS